MDDTTKLIYNELLEIKHELKLYIDSIDRRVSVLEEFKNKTLGIVIIIGCIVGCAIDFIRERIM